MATKYKRTQSPLPTAMCCRRVSGISGKSDSDVTGEEVGNCSRCWQGGYNRRMELTTSITALKGVGSASATRLKKLGITTVADLLHHFPRRYEDYSRVVSIQDARPGTITVKGEITRMQSHKTRRGKTLTKALIDDGTGAIQAVWFNQPYVERSLPKRTPVYVAGELAFSYNQYALQSPTVERVSAFPRNAARIVPIYPVTEGITSKQIRYWLGQVLPAKLDDPIPESVRETYDLMDKTGAVANMHFPRSMEDADRARYRLAFEELYILFLALRDIKCEVDNQEATPVTFDREAIRALVADLPFSLTGSQRKSAWRIIQDMQREHPMNRLLQGDVGSGKTVVAAIAAAVVANNRLQTAFLAPTAILAGQHEQTLRDILAPLGVEVALVTGANRRKERGDIIQRLRANQISVVVGTHALLEDDVTFSGLGLVIIDEQHRFGVDQRKRLQEKASNAPHVLSMTATPIPRSLALTVYGELDISFLADMPPGRKSVKTFVTTNADWVYRQLQTLLDSGGKIYVVCPLIEESDTHGIKSVQQEARTLQQYLPEARIISLNGRMKPGEKAETMQRFADGEADILVATTVVEVGVDVADATAIVVEGAERFGLATLHQLRGRVGRNTSRAFCYLKPTDGFGARQRLQLMEQHNDGRLLAEKDLELRGAGEIYGERQHGALDMRLARLSDAALINTARQAAADTPESDMGPVLKELVNNKKNQKHLN
ncbi:ATP-dependent DNA helicase RecG [Candidatus Saccharibacteria bacterium QS_5_54_17]|nr:MAG: ATP-dependent DNA helicase RecG [Candidatus Saccharibacteria bacterium QS_5_54_17]